MARRPPLVLVDGFNLLWRAAFGFPARITRRDGTDVTAPFGFFALLRKALRELGQPSECIVVFDGEDGWAGRLETDRTYKQHRLEADFSPIDWLPAIQAALSDHRVRWLESDRWEADDVIATLARSTRSRQVLIMSTDRDFYQLIGPRVRQLNTARSATRRFVTELEIAERFGVEPDQWCDYVALVGDPSDGIPGVGGIGPMRATALLSSGLRLTDLPGSGRLGTGLGRRVAEQYEQAIGWCDLIRLRSDLDLPFRPTGRSTAELPLAARVLEGQGIW